MVLAYFLKLVSPPSPGHGGVWYGNVGADIKETGLKDTFVISANFIILASPYQSPKYYSFAQGVTLSS